jgi:hypothetical protein
MKNYTLFFLLTAFINPQEGFCDVNARAPSSKSRGPSHQPLKSILYIHNENTKDLSILIKPELVEDRSVDDIKRVIDPREGEWLTLTLPANSLIEFEIPQKELGENIDKFSITGETNPLTPIGKCSNLMMGRHYTLRFTDNPFGTDCYSQEIKGKFKHTTEKRIKVPYTRSNPHTVNDPRVCA